jgi:hypothetical protein
MKTSTLTTLLQIAGLLHILLLCAGASMPKAVQLRTHLGVLPPFIRRLFLVYFSFIGLVLAGFGALTFFFAHQIAAGEPLARGLCVLLIAFWGLRVIAMAFILDVRPYLTNWFYRLGYHTINLIFIYLLAVYVFAVWKGGGF